MFNTPKSAGAHNPRTSKNQTGKPKDHQPSNTDMMSRLNYKRLPRSSCSRSMASNKDLKFPAPKPEKLFLWMISMKTVGLSIRCCGKCQSLQISWDTQYRTFVKSWRRYPPSSKSIRMSKLLSISKSSLRFIPALCSLFFMEM